MIFQRGPFIKWCDQTRSLLELRTCSSCFIRSNRLLYITYKFVLNKIVSSYLKAFIRSNSVYRCISSENNFSGHLLVLPIAFGHKHCINALITTIGKLWKCMRMLAFQIEMQHNAFSIGIGLSCCGGPGRLHSALTG